MGACLKLVRKHQPATDKTADIEIEKILDALATPEAQLGKTGRRNIVQQIGGRTNAGFDLGDNIDFVPVIKRARRQVELAFPSGKRARHRDAGAQNAGPLFGRQILQQARKIVVDEPQGGRRVGQREPLGPPRQNGTVKTHRNQVKRPAADLDADRHGAKRIQRKGC